MIPRRTAIATACVRPLAPSFSMHRVDAAPVRKPEVHKSHVRFMLSVFRDSFLRVRSLSHQQHIRLIVDDGSEALAQKWMVVHA
jgi:hypothetical protein